MHTVFVDGKLYVEADVQPTPEVGPAPAPEPDELAVSFDSAAFYSSIRESLFGRLKQSQVDGLKLIGSTCERCELEPMVEQTAYVLATVYHETAATMQPIAEYGGRHRRYAPWYGRGHVQLTWETNYKKQQNKLSKLPFVKDNKIPYKVHDDKELALNPQTSAIICVLGMKDGDFTGKGLSRYINNRAIDYVGARRIVNGTDRALLIASHARKFESAIKAGRG